MAVVKLEEQAAGKVVASVKQRAVEAKTIPMSSLLANDYNPNRMPDVEMDLLRQCIEKYGFLFPIIVVFDAEKQKYRIIDGYHRYETLRRMGAQEAAVVELELSYHDAVQLTVLMNRIKGLHQVELMSDLVVKLHDLGLEDDEICKNLGMEIEEYIRLKQQLGIAHSFRKHVYTNSWTVTES
jgi:ParB-like chromosome segregation protein Spo0J